MRRDGYHQTRATDLSSVCRHGYLYLYLCASTASLAAAVMISFYMQCTLG